MMKGSDFAIVSFLNLGPKAMSIPFKKMHGLGNDFVVIDARGIAGWQKLSHSQARAIADRKRGVGCDQLVIMENAPDKSADVFMRLYNVDGHEAEACGNATRCVAYEIFKLSGKKHITIQTLAGLLECDIIGDHLVRVDMGIAKLDWRDIPLREACDTAAVALHYPALPDAVCVNMGNPHAVFFIGDAESIDIASHGPKMEHHPMFPQRCNIEFATVIDRNTIRMRVWERSVGITEACGTGACATLVAASRKNLTERKATLILDGGNLEIEWLKDGHVLMTGEVAEVFAGQFDLRIYP